MNIIINNSSMQPIYEQVVDQIRNRIIKGELKEHDILPSVRSLSKELRISALTVKKAYDTLEQSGFIITVHGKGSYVANTNRELAIEEQRREVENEFEKTIEKARSCNMTEEEIRELFEIILEG